MVVQGLLLRWFLTDRLFDGPLVNSSSASYAVKYATPLVIGKHQDSID